MSFPSTLGALKLGSANLGQIPTGAAAGTPVPVFYMHYSRMRRMVAIFLVCGLFLLRDLLRRI